MQSTDIHNMQFSACLISRLKTWSFPAPRGGSVKISFPFHLNSVGYN
jgi:hypothetical protein